MPELRNTEIFYPPDTYVEAFHDELIKQSGTPGYLTKNMVSGCMDWARTEVYRYVPYSGLLRKAAAIMYSYITFHPFVDGNKRTALMTTSFFLFLNGYALDVTEDAPEFTASVAQRSADPGNRPETEIERIADWLRPRVGRTILMSTLHRSVRKRLKPGATVDVLLGHQLWNSYYMTWRIATTQRFKQLLGKWPGHTSEEHS